MINLDAMTSALRSIQNTIENLHINASVEVSRQEIDVPILSTKGTLDLTSFPRLTYLYIPWAFLMGFEPAEGKELIHALPKNLEILHLSRELDATEVWDWYGEGRVEDFEHEDNMDPTAMIAAVIRFLKSPDRPARLKSILFTWPRMEHQITTAQRNWLDDLFQTSAIRVGWSTTPWKFPYRDSEKTYKRPSTPTLELQKFPYF